MKIVREKVKQSSHTSTVEMETTRHSLDNFSLRYMEYYLHRDVLTTGFASFVALTAQQAWEQGKDVSKNRHKDENIIKDFQGIKWVFNRNGEIRTLITVI